MPNNTDTPSYITLQQVLKLANLVETGGQAKHVIQNGEVKVNGAIETRRRKKVYPGDAIEVAGEIYHIGEE